MKPNLFRRRLVVARTVMAGLVAVVGMSAGCHSNQQMVTPPPLPPPAPSVTGVSPNAGSTGGETWVVITGSGFQFGATVTVDGTAVTTSFGASTIMAFMTPVHAAGTVDVVVTNPDGQARRLTGGYTYALPESFDFNGTWDGYTGETEEPNFQFTIQNNVLTSVTCGAASPVTFSPPPPISNGEFSVARADGVGISGRIVSALQSIGTINIPLCGATAWGGSKR